MALNLIPIQPILPQILTTWRWRQQLPSNVRLFTTRNDIIFQKLWIFMIIAVITSYLAYSLHLLVPFTHTHTHTHVLKPTNNFMEPFLTWKWQNTLEVLISILTIKLQKIFTNKCTFYWIYKMLKFTLKYLIFAPICFGPSGPSSGSLRWAWPKLHFCRINQ
jgi:hypothetical protein